MSLRASPRVPAAPASARPRASPSPARPEPAAPDTASSAEAVGLGAFPFHLARENALPRVDPFAAAPAGFAAVGLAALGPRVRRHQSRNDSVAGAGRSRDIVQPASG